MLLLQMDTSVIPDREMNFLETAIELMRYLLCRDFPTVTLQSTRPAASLESSRLGKAEDERMAQLKSLAAQGPIQIQRRV